MNISDKKFPLVTIGLPVVKKEFLESAIISCLNQTYLNLEIIIVNDAFTNELKDSIERIVFSFSDKRIKYFKNESPQLSIIENWNKTLSFSTGQYFSMLCDDDCWDEKYIETMVSLTVKYPQVSVFHSRTIIMNALGKMIRIAPNCPEYEDILDFIYNRLAMSREHFLSDFFVKTESLIQIGGFVNMPFAWGSDDLTWFYLAKNTGVVASQEPLFYYRDSPLSTTNNMLRNKKIETTNAYFEKIREFLLELPVECDEMSQLKKKMILENLGNYKKGRVNGIRNEYLKNKKYPSIIYWIIYIFYKLKYR